MSTTSSFTIEGRRFEVSRLSPEDACAGFEVLGRAFGASAVALLIGEKPDPVGLMQGLVNNASKLSVMLGLFLPKAKFDRGNNGILVDLKPFADEVFGGRLDVLIAFVVQAVRAEYATFLGGSPALVELVAAFGVSSSESPTAPTA